MSDKIWVDETGQPTNDKLKPGGWTTPDQIGKGLDLGPERPPLETKREFSLQQSIDSKRDTQKIKKTGEININPQQEDNI